MTQSVLKAFNRTFFNLNFRVFAVLSSTSLSRSECLRLVEALHVDRTTLRHKFDAATQCQGGLVVPRRFGQFPVSRCCKAIVRAAFNIKFEAKLCLVKAVKRKMHACRR